MAHFVAIKVHYDHRARLAQHLKYTDEATPDEHREYLSLFHEGIGGNGFHECMNFNTSDEDGHVQIYLPPTCVPAKKYWSEDLVIFSFTYKDDQEQPSCVVGVHAGARILSKEGIERAGYSITDEIDPLTYHAEAPTNLVTLFAPPIKYDITDGVYTPRYKLDRWGYGLRILSAEHAQNIIRDALAAAEAELAMAPQSTRFLVEKRIRVLGDIAHRYLDGPNPHEPADLMDDEPASSSIPPPPDKEIGHLGERAVYDQELKIARGYGADASRVEWVSQAVPTSPFDIKSVRKTEDGLIRDHFIEVKSSKVDGYENTFISDRQVEFFRKYYKVSSFKLVAFSDEKRVKSIRELTFDQLNAEFDLVPTTYKLKRRS